MKLNISNSATGQQKSIEIDDDRKLLPFYDKRMAAEVPGDSLGEEFKGYIFKITGGNDKQGFPMMQGVLTANRVRLLFRDGMKCFRERRRGQFKRKSVRGCIVGPQIGVLALKIVQKGEQEIPGLTDEVQSTRLGPKRARKIMKLYGMDKDTNGKKLHQSPKDICSRAIRRPIEGKKKSKAVRIQRLVTDDRLHRKKKRFEDKVNKAKQTREKMAEYMKLMENYQNEKKRQQHLHHHAGGSAIASPKKTPAPAPEGKVQPQPLAPKAKSSAGAKAKSSAGAKAKSSAGAKKK